MAERLIVIGASGFGRETLDVAEAVNAAATDPVWDIAGVVDDNPSEANLLRLKDRAVTYLGTLAELSHWAEASLVIGVGSPALRSDIAQRIARPVRWASLVHPSAVLGSQVRLGAGVVICAGVSVGTNVEIADHVHLNPHAVVGHDTRLDAVVSINPNATVSGECVIESGVLIGAGATVMQGLTVGSNAKVGAAACVTSDIDKAATVKGVPAR